MKGNGKVSMAVIRRLPKYLGYLTDLLENDVTRISSQELSKLTGFTASQIRQDLNNFGGFGQQGYGYNVEDLHEQLGKILGLKQNYDTILVGAGNLGQAIANYKGFENAGFKLTAIFDNDKDKIGKEIRGIEIRAIDEMENFLKENEVSIGIICTSKDSSQAIADRLVDCGITGIWNFAPRDLKVPDNVIVEDVHLNESLFTLSYLLKENSEREK